MKKAKPSKLLRGAIAAVLACGLMLPTAALAADDAGGEIPQAAFLTEPDDKVDQSVADPAADESPVAAGIATALASSLASPDSSPETALAEEETLPGTAAAIPSAADEDGWTQVGSLKVKGGTYGVDYTYTSGPMQYRGSNYAVNGAAVSNVVEVLTDAPLTFKDAVPFDEAQASNASAYSPTAIAVREGVHADVTFDGVNIRHATPVNILTNSYDTESGAKATDGSQVRNRTSLHLTLADGSQNRLWSTTNYTAPIHCGEGSDFTLDDSVRNVDAGGNPVIPVGGIINDDVTLAGGKQLSKGQLHSVLDSANPGKLTIFGVQDAASIGGNNCETGGRMTFNGGILEATYAGSSGCAAGIGAGSGGNGTDTLILFNSGSYTVAGGYHGAGVGAACYDGYSGSAALQPDVIQSRSYNTPTVAGDITIHGGYIRASGGGHGNGFGAACWSGAAGYNSGHTITVTGGTLYPTGSVGDLGGYNGYVVITGGSVYSGAGKFVGIGNTAWGNDAYKAEGYNPNQANDPNKVSMMTINLKSEIEKRNAEASPAITSTAYDERLTSWTLTVGGKEYEYGAPKQFFDGQLFLWLPASAFSQEVTVTLKYIDKNGKEQTIEPLFREPSGSQSGTTLKRYIHFNLPDDFKDLKKYYDGEPLKGLTIDDQDNKIPTDDGKELTKPGNISYKYQLYSADQQTPIGTESSSASEMPCNVGYMKLTIDSNQFSSDPGFSTNYWGHRATGWCEILPIDSKVTLDSATWEDGKGAHNEDSASKRLTIEASIGKAERDPAGNPTGAKCKAPRGSVQLYVDKKAVGEPVKLVFEGDKDDEGNVIAAGDPRINAVEVPHGEGSYTSFTYSFIPADSDFLLPDATTDNRHIVSLQYLQPAEDAGIPRNYLDSVNPIDDPEAAPKAELAIEPIDPNPATGLEKPAGFDPDLPEPVIKTDAPTPDKPGADPTKPGDKTYTGEITLYYKGHEEGQPNPGRVELKLDTPSSGPVKVTTADGTIVAAELKRDENGNPVRDKDGKLTVLLDPEAVGKTELVIKQEPNGAYTGTTFDYRVTVRPDPQVKPVTSVSKMAKNLTHPNGPTQSGDRILYTITASNTAAGSAWNNVVISDPLPACLELAAGSMRMTNPSEGVNGPLAPAASPSVPALGQYLLAAPGADGRRILTVPAGTVGGGKSAVVTFECTVKEGLTGRDAPAASLENVASATGTRPDPDDPYNPDAPELPENPSPSAPVTPPGGSVVAPDDPAEGDLVSAKTVENLTSPSAKVTRLGDRLRYTVTLENKGAATACLQDVVLSDPVPRGMAPVPGTFELTDASGKKAAVKDTAWNAQSRTLALWVGDLWGGESATLAFEVEVTEPALFSSTANIARWSGSLPSSTPDPEKRPEPEKPGTPAPGPGSEEPRITGDTPEATPPVVIPDDPAEGDVTVTKEAENATSSDGKTRVGDTVRYTVRLANSGPGTGWMDAVIRDDVPVGLEPVAGSIRMGLPDGGEVAVDDAAYDDKSRRLSVSAGRVYGGQEVVLAFDALVTEEAVGADIGNVAAALGTLPSDWNPDTDGAFPAAGQPFDAPEGWQAFDSASQKVESPAAYPPGTDEKGGVLPAEDGAKADDSTTIKRTRLAQTGDALIGMAAFGAAMAFASLTVLALARRRIGRES